VDTQEKLTFRPGEFRIYTSRRLVPPQGFFTSSFEPPLVEIALHPSLISDESTIYGQLPSGNAVESVIFTDMTGKPHGVSFLQVNDSEFKLSVPDNIPSGMYIVTVRSKNGLYTGKVIKQ
jgi:hypothetical protein